MSAALMLRVRSVIAMLRFALRAGVDNRWYQVLSRVAVATREIFTSCVVFWRHCFQVIRIHAATMQAFLAAPRARQIISVTDVIDEESSWNWSVNFFPRNAVSTVICARPIGLRNADYSVPTFVKRAGKMPASVRGGGCVDVKISVDIGYLPPFLAKGWSGVSSLSKALHVQRTKRGVALVRAERGRFIAGINTATSEQRPIILTESQWNTLLSVACFAPTPVMSATPALPPSRELALLNLTQRVGLSPDVRPTGRG